MKTELLSAFIDGFKGSFRLCGSLISAVFSTINAFAHEKQASGSKSVRADKRREST
jgi:hypothetical protein